METNESESSHFWRDPSTARAPARLMPLLALAAALVAGAMIPTLARAQYHPKAPGRNKLSGGATRQAFSGKIKSLDIKQGILNMTVPDRDGIVMFPIRKHVSVRNADGSKRKLKSLKPGASLLIYYDQKSGGREVKQIIVLAPAPPKKAKKSFPRT